MIGIIVDDAVIVGENIHLEYERGRTGTDAAITGAYLVAKPVFFAVITTMIAFVPWLLLDGWQVQFVKNISYIVIFALAFSLIEAFFILPSHLANLKPHNEKSKFARIQKKFADGIVRYGKNSLYANISCRTKEKIHSISLLCFCINSCCISVIV